MPRPSEPSRRSSGRLGELALLFLKLGTIGFGGPAAHIAMMEDEVVRRRGWLTREAFLDLVAAANLIPGPNSTELAIHIGYQRAGALGLVVAGLCFILPAALIVMAAAWAYVHYGQLPEAAALLYGIKPIIIVIVFQALIGLGRTALKTRTLIGVGAIALVLCALGVHELLLLLGAGIVTAIVDRLRPPVSVATTSTIAVTAAAATATATASASAAATTTAAAVAAAAVPFSMTTLFLFFLKVGSVLFGSGYVLLAFLRADLVDRWGWLTNAQLLDAVAIGQVTPGPLFTTATFIGYVLAGPTGAVVATVGIFLPAFVFVALSGPLVPRLRRSAIASAFLDGVVVASLALMAFVSVELARSALIDPVTIAAAAIAAVLLLRWRINSVWLVMGGALLGLIAHAVR